MAKSMMCDFAQANGERALWVYLLPIKRLQSIYFTTFCVTESGDLFIGCIQGARGSIEDRSDIIKSLTKAQHGMRPKVKRKIKKPVIVELTIMFARHFGLSNAYCVTNKGHVYNASDYRSRRQRKKNDV